MSGVCSRCVQSGVGREPARAHSFVCGSWLACRSSPLACRPAEKAHVLRASQLALLPPLLFATLFSFFSSVCSCLARKVVCASNNCFTPIDIEPPRAACSVHLSHCNRTLISRRICHLTDGGHLRLLLSSLSALAQFATLLSSAKVASLLRIGAEQPRDAADAPLTDFNRETVDTPSCARVGHYCLDRTLYRSLGTNTSPLRILSQ